MIFNVKEILHSLIPQAKNYPSNYYRIAHLRQLCSLEDMAARRS